MKPPSKAKLACTLIDQCLAEGTLEVFSSAVDETPCATFTVEQNGDVREHRETHAVRGGAFSRFVRLRYWAIAGEPLFGEAMTAALAHAEMRALLGDRRELHARVAHLPDRVIVDAGDAGWGAYEITATGFGYQPRHAVPFIRSKGTMPFAPPVRGRTLLDLFAEILGIATETAKILAAWVVCGYCAGPYLVLVLHGEQGAGKSTAARALRALTDPSAVPLRTPPRESRDLVVAARASHVLAYDNLSSLPQWLSDALSTLATGGGYEARALYTDLDEILVQFRRPILLNGIENPVISADLLDRSLVAQLEPISETTRRSEEEIDADLAALAGELAGAVFAAVSAAIANVASTRRPSWARMVDATRWALAAANGLGTTCDQLERVLKANRARRDELVLESSVFATAVIEFASTHAPWVGTTAELKHAVETETEIGRANVDHRTVWPQTIQKVTSVMAREAPILRRQGVEWVETSKRRGVTVRTLTYEIDPS